MKTLIASALLAACLCPFAGEARAADCGAVSVAEMKWASAGVAAHVDRIILESGYGCTVTLVAGDTMPTFASMDGSGEPDVAPEMWVNAVRAPLDAAIAEGRLIQLSPILSEGGVEGWWMPRFIAESHPDIRTVQDALQHPDLFPGAADPSRGAVHSCPPGWNCRVTTANLFRALEADKAGFTLVEAATAEELDRSIAAAFENKTGWLGYYWAPTSLLGRYQMTKLSFGVDHDKAEWDTCTSVPDCPAPKVNSYPTSDVFTVVTKAFSEKAAVAMDYMKVRRWDNGTVGQVLAWMDENGGTTEDAARHFLRTYPDLWRQWVTPDVARRVEAAL